MRRKKLFCQKCGASNQDNAAFCSSCGAALASSPSSAGPNPAENPPQSVPPVSSYQRKDPIIAALLSFFLFGLGYLYLGYKKVLGLSTIVFVILVLVVYILLGFYTFGLLEFVVGILLAYDSYVKAKGERGMLGTEPEFLYGRLQ